MKITRQQFNTLMNAAIEAGDSGGEAMLTDTAVLAGLAAIGIEIEPSVVCECSVNVREYCASRMCHGGEDVFTWVERTWVDVRLGDVIRPVGQTNDAHAARVTAIGPVNRWHAAPGASQYRPNESPLEWSARAVTLLPLRTPGGDADASTFTPEHGMRPDAAVDIRVTHGELAAIEALGGWENRVGLVTVIHDAQEQGIVTS